MTIPIATLQGRFVRLEPLRREHAPGLFLAADEGAFRYLPTRPAHWDLGGFMLYVNALVDSRDIVAYTVIDLASERFAGMTAVYDIRPEHRGVEVGRTWLSAEFRGSRVNPEMKLLLLTHLFETRVFAGGPALRVQFKTDARNTQSQRAMEKIGLVREGVLRKHLVLADGFARDSVVYSVIDTEWPAMKAGLLRKLEAT